MINSYYQIHKEKPQKEARERNQYLSKKQRQTKLSILEVII